MLRYVAALSILFFAQTLPIHAASADDYDSARAAFSEGKYQDALRQFESHPRDDSAYFYNLGTTLLKLNRVGTAEAYLEKANRMQPHDIAIQQNLQLARNALSQTLGAEKMDPASSWLETISDNLRLDEIRGAFGLVSFIIALFWIRSYLKTRKLRETLLKPAGLLGIGALLLTSGLYGIERLAVNAEAVCLDRTSIRSGPGDTYSEVGQAEAGTKLRALGPTSETLSTGNAPAASAGSPTEEASPTPSLSPSSTGDTGQSGTSLWRQVRYSADGIGWVRASSVLLL
jgi:tetratricopeptide (TPR) repeat protein